MPKRRESSRVLGQAISGQQLATENTENHLGDQLLAQRTSPVRLSQRRISSLSACQLLRSGRVPITAWIAVGGR